MRTKIALAIVCAGLLLMECANATGGSTETSSKISSMVYNPGGSPAKHAKVRFYPVNYNPRTGGLGKTAATIDSTYTDTNGNYVITLDTGIYYTIQAGSDSGLTFNDSVKTFKDSTVRPDPDTLKPAGSIKGIVRLEEGGDPTTVFILFMGTRTFTFPDDTSGSFTSDSMAAGNYRVRILTTTPNYRTLDTTLRVIAGTQNVLPNPLVLQYTGIPTPKNIRIVYDTLKQIVPLMWDSANASLVSSYNVYRRNVGLNTVLARINVNPVTGTSYIDSSGVQDSTYEYQVAAVNASASEGVKSAGIIIRIIPAYHLLDSIGMSVGYGNARVVVSKNGFIVDRSYDVITVFDSSFNSIGSFNLPTDFGNGIGHEIDDSNRIWAANYNTGEINIYSLNGTLIDSIRDTGLLHPQVLKQSPDGNMFIQSTPTGANFDEVRIYDHSGTFVSLFPNDSNPIKPSIVTDMTFSVTGDFIILNHSDSTITRYDSIGTILQQVKLRSFVVRIGQLSNGNYAIEQEGNRGIINILNSNFDLLSIFENVTGIGYQDFGYLTVGPMDKLIIRNLKSILVYVK